MKKHLKKFLWLSPFLLFGLYWVGIYLSLKNPMEEINYSEMDGLMRYVMFKPLQKRSEVIASGRKMKDFKCIPIQIKSLGDKKTCPS